MSKWIKIPLVILAILVIAWITGRVTGALQYYRLPTESSEPNIHKGESFFTSNLKSPKRGDFVAYVSEKMDSLIFSSSGNDERKQQTYIHRMCATENDLIQMKDAVLFVNGKNADADIDLYHFYTTPVENESKIPDDFKNNDLLPPINNNHGLLLLNLSKRQLKNYKGSFPVTLYIDSLSSGSDNGPFKWYDKNNNWTTDNFGPLLIPPGYCFVIGDNRNNSLDSRYAGFIKLSEIKGVKL